MAFPIASRRSSMFPEGNKTSNVEDMKLVIDSEFLIWDTMAELKNKRCKKPVLLCGY